MRFVRRHDDWLQTMFIRRSSVISLLSILIVGCSSHPDETWIAEARIPVYDSIDGKVAFYLQPSERCEPGMDMAGKVDMYTKVRRDSGTGWVTGGEFRKVPRTER
ncbi:hypothetical protein FEP12_02990 [Burkholderia multivorans]|nr:hypothetical protein [Burkholderia multivorans]MDR9182037.1 hypothetical protein [Burkholderia multivorans]MDR9188114.1 hypothetical protein [Burkholderia multivorans]MDR9192152.1 hypothetical protein [Burkholderia multivorans]MDR9199770.1 hypothetical protein [Burkholderia multivorans]